MQMWRVGSGFTADDHSIQLAIRAGSTVMLSDLRSHITTIYLYIYIYIYIYLSPFTVELIDLETQADIMYIQDSHWLSIPQANEIPGFT